MSVKDYYQINKKYFAECSHEIAQRNLKLMKTVCYCGIAVFISYYLVTFAFFRARMISVLYALLIPVLALFLLIINHDLKNDVPGKRAEVLTISMYLVVMTYCILMSVVAHPDLHAVYFPLFLVLGPVMFILPLFWQLFINTASFAAFVLLVLCVKPEPLWMHDLFEALTALVFSVIVILLMTQFRIQSDSLKSKYYSLSRHDGLTELLNKTAGSNMIRNYIENHAQSEPFVLILLDIDDFKSVNDTYGHESGDAVLKTFARFLAEELSGNSVISRYGGDEFLILLENLSEKDCEEKLISVRKKLGGIRFVGGIPITISIGIAAGSCGEGKFEVFLNRADKALYDVKQHGKNAYRFYR